jgi:hypothetical protein
MRDNGTLYYLHGDNLGSASLTTNASGAVVSQNKYYPFGASRLTQRHPPDGFGLHRAEVGWDGPALLQCTVLRQRTGEVCQRGYDCA